MLKNVANWILALGGLTSFTGLLFLPAAFYMRSTSGDENLLGAGLTIFALGALLAASGLYLMARSLWAEIDSDPSLLTMLQAGRRKGACDGCQQRVAVIACTIHKENLCPACMVEHYQSLACVYVPTVRRGGGKFAKAAAAARA